MFIANKLEAANVFDKLLYLLEDYHQLEVYSSVWGCLLGLTVEVAFSCLHAVMFYFLFFYWVFSPVELLGTGDENEVRGADILQVVLF